MQVRRGRVREGSEFVHQLRAPSCSPRLKSLCLSEYSADKKASERSELIKEGKTHIFFLLARISLSQDSQGYKLGW